MITALEALEKLREGNRRFATGVSTFSATGTIEARRAAERGGQSPFAVILGCSDSRVPAEIVFDQGIGDLFVVRVAGNIVAPSQVGSVEFAATSFGTRLVVVLGHSQCGAIRTTIAELRQPSTSRSRNLQTIVDFVRPSIEPLLETNAAESAERLEHEAVRANVRNSAEHLRYDSGVLEGLRLSEGLVIVGAEYSLETGLVDFFDGVPES